MSKNIIMNLSELTVKELRSLASLLDLNGRSKWTTKEVIIQNIMKSGVCGVMVHESENNPKEVVYMPVVEEFQEVKHRKRVKTTVEGFNLLVDIATELGVSTPFAIIEELSDMVRAGAKLGYVVENPEKYDVSPKWMSTLMKASSLYDMRRVKSPTREGAIAVSVALRYGEICEVTGKVRVKGIYQRQNQSALSDVVAKEKKHFVLNANKTYSFATHEQVESNESKELRDMTNIAYIDATMPLEEGQDELSELQLQIQECAFRNGMIVELEGGIEKEFKYLYQTPSQRRLVQATFCADIDPIKVLEDLGHDFRSYAKYVDGKWIIDTSKAISRFGLSGTNSIVSQLVKIGNVIEHFDNGDVHLVGGTHTMRVTSSPYAIVQSGQYKVYNTETREFEVYDAKDNPRKMIAGDGLIFVDDSVYKTLVAEFGLDTSAWQVRITPFTKGLMVFVPGLKNLYGADIVALDTAVKGDYEALLRSNPSFSIDMRIALFNKPARMAKKYTNIPYQFLNTLPVEHDAYIEMADKHLDRAFELYEDPKLMSDYLGLHVLEDLENLSDEDLSEEERELAKNTLVSRFSEFLYSGEFTMKDPMMKKYAKDIILNVIKEWTFGSVPVEGHYRFMVQDPYAILNVKRRSDEFDRRRVENPLKDRHGDIIIPADEGIAPETVFMIDDNDEFMMENEYVVFNRNPKIAFGETGLAKTAITKEYAIAREKYPMAFANTVVFSVHDFTAFKQGGADFDGDTTLAITESAIVEAVKQKNDNFPAMLDLSLKDGKIIEGVPFTNPDMNPNEFKMTFSDEEYSHAFAHQLHNVSVEYVLRTLEPNDIGLLTNYATKILDAVSKLRIAVKEKQTLDGTPMSAEIRQSYISSINDYLYYTDILRLAQGWEIDKAKHGGYYKQFMDLSFCFEPEKYPHYVTKIDENDRRVWITPDWMAARKGREGDMTTSLIQRIRNHVLNRYETEIVEAFMNMDAVSSDHNITAELSVAIQTPAFYDDIKKAVRLVSSEYKRDIARAIMYRNEKMEQLDLYIVRQGHKKVSRTEKARYESIIEDRFSGMMDMIIEKSNAKMSALEVEFNVHPSVLGLAAYEITYAENNNINRNIKDDKDPTTGLSFPWNGAKYHLLSAVRLASGKDMRITNIEKVDASDVEIRIGNLMTDASWIKENALARGKMYVWNQEITDANDPLFGYNVFNVYVGAVKVGTVFADKAHAFSGHDKWEVNIKDITFKANKNTNTVRSMSILLDTVVPYIKH